MIDLSEYGFTKKTESEKCTEYIGHGYNVYIYSYFVKTFDQSEIAHNTFLVTSQQFTSRSRPISELQDWLTEKKIEKK